MDQQPAVINLLQPLNFALNLSFHSPLILTISIVILTLMFQNFKGLIYLGWLIGVCFLRHVTYSLRYGGKNKPPSENPNCSSVVYGGKYGDSHISIFIFAFTIIYFFAPMVMYQSYNIPLLFGLIAYGAFDAVTKSFQSCLNNMEVFLNIVAGIGLSYLCVFIMSSTGGGKYLYFNEVSSDREVCSVAKNQTFKCAVYKNGELIGNM